jgi:S-adenosylmethionine:diacylglycerol 3-amino-3-carboxypropyl transferase
MNSLSLPVEISELVKQAKVNYHESIDEPPVFLEINGSIFGTMGNFSVVTGKAKARKTFFVTMVMAAAVSGKLISRILEGNLPAEKSRVIYFDTEQSLHHVHIVANRVLQVSGNLNPENFDVYKLRNFSTDERIAIINHVIRNTPDAGLIVIDRDSRSRPCHKR